MALGWVLTSCCYNSLSLGVDAMPRHKHYNVRMSICGYCMFLIDSTQCSSFLPFTSWLLESKWILISLFCFGIFKEHKVIQPAWFICQLHLLCIWALFKKQEHKRSITKRYCREEIIICIISEFGQQPSSDPCFLGNNKYLHKGRSL